MPQVPTIFPAIYGSYALLKLLADEGEWSVYLIAINGAGKPWVIKRRPLQGSEGLDLQLAKADTKILARMTSPNLASVLTATEICGEVGIVVEHVPGKSLAAICARANERSVLLPPELGVVVAHDVLSAMAFFHDFEGASRVHGNISPRTILIGYSGEVKVAGYRPGFHPRTELDTHVAKDFIPLVSILCDLPFQRFPQKLTQIVPRLLEDKILPVEALAAVKGFLGGHAPSANDRQKVASWLEEIFSGERASEAQEEERLVSEGIKLIAKSATEKHGWSQNPVVGDEIGEYRIVKMLGEGGMGRVYEAEHIKTTKHVALKVLHPKGRSHAIEERFRREAESILRIANPHVVDIECFGPSADGKFLYLAMELICGKSLDRVIFEEKPFAPLRALEIASQICQALTVAHEAGVIHRDLKPGNVMLVDRDENPDFVKVLDFGLARIDVGESALTRAGDLIGTFAYMAPEQGQGKPATPKIDIYAVGEVLYEMLTKKLPHEGAEEILARKATVDATPIVQHRPDLPEEVSQLVMKALARNPQDRHSTMDELAQEIDSIIEQLSARLSVFQRPWFKIVAASVAASFVFVGITFLIAHQGGRSTSKTKSRETASPTATVTSSAAVQPLPTLPSTNVKTPVQIAPVIIASSPPTHQKSGETEKHSSKRRSNEPSADDLLVGAEKAFEDGNNIEAIQLGNQALELGGGLRAHLALGKYYQNRRRYPEALEHYRAAIQMDPGNSRAAKGIEIVQKKLSPDL